MKKDELEGHLGEVRGQSKPRDVGKIIRLSLSGLAALLLVIFCIQNASQVPVRVLFWSGDMALIWVIVISAILGAIAFGVVRAVLGRRRNRRR